MVLLPIARLGEPGKSPGKSRVVPAPRKPPRIVDHAQRPQRFDERDFAAIEGQKLLVSLEQIAQLRAHLLAAPGEQHPQILNGGPGQTVVEIDEVRPLLRPQDVAAVTVAENPSESGSAPTLRAHL